MKYFVYILYSDKVQKFYIGQTNNIDQRIKRHNAGSEKFTSKGVPWKLIWFTKKNTRSEAMILEKKIKNLSQNRLLKFIQKYSSDIQNMEAIDILEKRINNNRVSRSKNERLPLKQSFLL